MGVRSATRSSSSSQIFGYRHRGRYYTIEERIDFDQHGLLDSSRDSFIKVWFTEATLVLLIERFQSGLLSRELTRIVQVEYLDHCVN
ncbi:MAG: hypothetical protein OXF08_06575 [Bacteroidetes bacterium]|nr:hypothetical protein [Bacteroidota bacterium]